jgi:hypothetical protein
MFFLIRHCNHFVRLGCVFSGSEEAQTLLDNGLRGRLAGKECFADDDVEWLSGGGGILRTRSPKGPERTRRNSTKFDPHRDFPCAAGGAIISLRNHHEKT